MDESPIACTLGPAEGRQRERDIASLGRDALLSVERGDRRVTLRFRPDGPTRERVAQIAVAEAQCCAFLAFDLIDEPGAHALTISAPPGGEALLHQLADAFAARV